jgi:hypothetical protein
MLMEMALRLLIGGLAVSAFALLGDVFKPKRFAGLFGAAPSVALATLGLTVAAHGKAYAASEARSMTAGALAFFAYASCVSWVMIRYRPAVLGAATLLIAVWCAVASVVWFLYLR